MNIEWILLQTELDMMHKVFLQLLQFLLKMEEEYKSNISKKIMAHLLLLMKFHPHITQEEVTEGMA